jgi:hypothetical protein
MDILKVFNLLVCADKKSEKSEISTTWFFNIIVAPVTILFTPTKFAILAWFTVLIFFLLIYTSENAIIKIFNTDKNGQSSWFNSLVSAILLYIFQCSIILLFLRFSICEKSLDWESNNYQLTLDHGDVTIKEDGY